MMEAQHSYMEINDKKSITECRRYPFTIHNRYNTLDESSLTDSLHKRPTIFNLKLLIYVVSSLAPDPRTHIH